MQVMYDVSQRGLNYERKISFRRHSHLVFQLCDWSTDNLAVMSLAAPTSKPNGMQHDSLSNFKIWLKPSLRNQICHILFLAFLSYVTKDAIRDVIDL